MTQKKPIYDFFPAHVCKFLFIFRTRGVFMKRILYACLPILAVFLFWACGEGSLEWTENNDILALERIDNVTEADFLKALDNCRENPDCRANTDSDLLNALDSCKDDDECRAEFFKKYIKKVVDPDTVDTAEVVSSSSEIDLFASSSSCDTCGMSGESDDQSSSSGLDSLESSSSTIPESSSIALSSSSVALSSSSPILSSSVIIKSSSSHKPTSSFTLPPSSADEESSSSVEDPCTKEKMGEGLCKVNKPEIKFGEEAKWTYVPVRECGVGLTGEWVLLEADEPGKDGLEATFKFATDKNVINQKVYPSLTVKKGKMSTTVDCSRATVKVTNATVIQSSSSVVPPSSAVIKSSSSSYVPPPEECSVALAGVNSGKWMCNLEGRKNEECVQSEGQWVCPAPGISSSVIPSSSSVTPPSSSSVVPPSSSSVVSSASQGPIEIQMTSNVRTEALKANQDYAVTYSCGTLQVLPPGGNNGCHVTVAGKTYDVGWDKQISTGPGTFIVSSDCDGFALNCW